MKISFRSLIRNWILVWRRRWFHYRNNDV